MLTWPRTLTNTVQEVPTQKHTHKGVENVVDRLTGLHSLVVSPTLYRKLEAELWPEPRNWFNFQFQELFRGELSSLEHLNYSDFINVRRTTLNVRNSTVAHPTGWQLPPIWAQSISQSHLHPFHQGLKAPGWQRIILMSFQWQKEG